MSHRINQKDLLGISAGRSRMQIIVCILVVLIALKLLNCVDKPNNGYNLSENINGVNSTQ